MVDNRLSSLLNQTCLSKLGAYVSERMSVDLYYLIEVIYHLIPVYGENNLENDFENYKKVKRKLEKLNKLLSKSKTFYDILSDKNFKIKFNNLDEFQKFLNKQFLEVSSKIPAIQMDIYRLFHFLLEHTTLKHQTIRSDMLKILEYRDNTKIDPRRVKQNHI